MASSTVMKSLVKALRRKNEKEASKPSGGPETAGGLLWQETWTDLSSWICVDAGGGFGNNELQYYSPVQARVDGGQLIITARAENGKYTSAKLFCRRPLGCESGYLEFLTCCIPQTRGLWPALWMLPTNGTEVLHDGKIWPDGGEIDMLECFGDKPDMIQAAHWGTYEPHQAHMHHTHSMSLPHLPRESHRIGLAFSGYSLTWFVDGRPTTSITVPSPPFSSLALFTPIVNLAMGGNLTGNVAPAEGSYEMRVGRVALFDTPPGGWRAFGEAHRQAQQTSR